VNCLPKLVAVVGGKHSGKTTVIEHLLAEFKLRGYRVGTIKEMVRIPTLDTPATETDRYSNAGAEIVVAVPRDETVVFVKKRLGLTEILPFVKDLDFVVLEGFETEKGLARVIASKTVLEAENYMDKSVIAVSGLLTQSEEESKKATCFNVPVVNVLVDASVLADLVMKKAHVFS
jgi:molybdopterin-guanine dinucleotide biosynthesis adapter protein